MLFFSTQQASRDNWAIEFLEERRLLAQSVAVNVAYSPAFPFVSGEIEYRIPTGYQTTVSGGVARAAVPGETPAPNGTQITGSVSIEWYQGPVIATIPLQNTDFVDPDPEATIPATGITLNKADAGTPIASGAYAGDYVLIAVYSGDANFNATAPFDYATHLSDYGLDALSYGVNVIRFTQGTSQLAFIQNPSNTAAADTIQPPITVQVQDSNGVAQTSSTDSITLALASSSTGTGALSGTTTEPAVGGIATFSDLSINTGGDYTLTATDATNPSFTAATSSSFNITAGKLVFLAPPLKTTQTAGDPLQPTIMVELEDGNSKPITTEDGSIVNLSLIGSTDTNPITGTTAALSGGIATFSNVVLTKPGTYQLQASDPNGDAMGTSNKFGIGGDTLKFTTQPKDTDPDQPLTVKVTALTSKGKPDTTLDDTIQLGLNVVSGGVDASLAGTTTLSLKSGSATFSRAQGVAVNVSGHYTLTATATTSDGADFTVTPAVSTPFAISADRLMIKHQPAGEYDVLAPIPLVVELVDSKGHLDTSENTAQVQLSLNPVKAASNAQLVGTITATISGGIATFTTAAGPAITGAGVFKITATEINTPDPASTIDTRPITIHGLSLLTDSIFESTYPLIYSGDRTPPTQKDDIAIDLAGLSGDVSASTDLPAVQVMVTGPDGQPTVNNGASVSPTIQSGTMGNGKAFAQANYDFNLTFTSTGIYHLQFQAVSTPGAIVDSSAIESLSQTLDVKSEFFQIGSIPRIAANQPFYVNFSIDQPVVRQQLRQPVIGLNPSVGASVQLASSTFSGQLTGTATAVASDVAKVGPLMISAPGIYNLNFTEVMSPGDSFDPTNFSTVNTTPVALSLPIRVLPDHLVITQQPPKKLPVGTPFTVSVALEDQNGHVLTDISGELTGDNGAVFNETPVAVLTLFGLSTKTADDFANLAPVPFVNGVATFSNLIISTHGLFTIHAAEQEQDPTTGIIQPNEFDIQVTATSIPFTVS